MKIVFTGGGTGGHVFPILAICREIRKNYPDLKLYFIGPKEKYAYDLLKKENVVVKRIITGKIRRYFSLNNILDFLKTPIGIIQGFFWVFVLSPDMVFSKGGYGSFPVSLAANILGVPFFLHESDAVPGKASLMQSKWALEIFVSFLEEKSFPAEKIICLGNPIREQVLNGSKNKAREIFSLQGEKAVILILGGSQGAQKINDTVLEVLPELLNDFELIHMTGNKHYNNVKIESQAIISEEEKKKRYHPIGFMNETQYKHAFAAADLVVSRAGSESLFEIAGNRKAAIVVPIADSAQGHQIKNAYAFEHVGGGEVIEQKNFTPHFFLERVRHLFSRPNIIQQMSRNVVNFARPKSAKVIASYIVEYVKALK